MNAHLETTFKKGFLLTEEALIKLDDIIRKRLVSAESAASLQFKVFRVDGMLLEFDNPGGVIAEENSSRNAIKRVEVSSSSTAHKMRLVFDPKEHVDLNIESNDRDLAYLLFSDIKEYLNAEVLKFRSFSFDSALSSKNVFPFLMLPLMFLSIYSIGDGPSDDAIAKVTQSVDVQAKLNFLIEHRTSAANKSFKHYMGGIIAVFFLLFFVGSGLDRVFPRNIFYWGKTATSHDRMLRVREKWIWGVVIAFFIGIASTVAVDAFKR